ncbi:AbgT family transporter [Corynebacterium sp. TAE3-ERU12]|uniref:AbgT family transporter n=1 Tax=Corynebacterium sp. TAE3-ERU12 TaxID=2849491 RepID=UPI001C455CE9|nr:AbgT family transporter [Corynebacterium sp. TAE3-ERU12]MBV7295657.1 AbgT family transporter [Corynebacterium sp. TAE3-ERU12]
MTETTTTERPNGFLSALERIGNKLPNPFWLFVILAGVVILSSWLGSMAGMSATDPGTGEEVQVQSLLTAEFLTRMVTDAVSNFMSFAPVGLIIVCMLGVAVAEYSGFIGTAMRAAIGKVSHGWLLTFVIALTGVTGSIASDAVYVILIPIGAAAFRAVGRNPIVGAMVAFAASSAGFNSSLVLNITDVLLAGISTSAAQFVDPEYVVSPLSNYFFSMASAIVLALIITAVTEFFVESYAARTMNDDEIDYEAASFTSGGNNDDEEAEEDEDSTPKLEITDKERSGLIAGSIAALVVTAIWAALLFIPGSPLRGEGDGILNSPLLTDIVVPIALLFAATGIAYGIRVGTIENSGDIPAFMEKGMGTLTTMMVLFFAVSQFTAYFDWSNLGRWTAIRGAELLTRADLPPLLLFAALVLLVALLNLFITSGSAQWALMAPVVVPMLMYVDIAPEVTQMLFRIGDSPTNIITPMSPYFALALTFLQRYRKNSGVGTLISLTIPYSLAMIVGWFAFFVVWYLAGIDLGPGVPVR